MTSCAYRREDIKKIEEEWIDKNVKDEEERKRKKEILKEILLILGDEANCKFNAIEGSEFCIFHDPNYWKENPEEVSKEFLNLLNNGEKNFIGFHLPEIEFPKVINEEIHMELAKFHELASFNETTFKDGASFDGATFNGKVSFEEATFKDVAWFIRATFEDVAWFEETTFKDEALFDELLMEDSAYVIFTSSIFEKPHLVSFKDTEIMRFLFLSSDIEKISLTNAKFKEKTLKVHELLNNPKEEVGFNYTFDDIIETYCRLRGNLEKNHRFSDAGIFFRGEMEARRTRKYYEFLRKYEKENKKDFIEKVFFKIKKFFLWMYVNLFSPYALYKIFSMYGESILRPILCSFITIFLMPIFFTFGGSSISFQSFLSNIGKSIGLFFQLAPVNYKELPSIIPMLELLERILGLLFSFLEAMALKRMLERHP